MRSVSSAADAGAVASELSVHDRIDERAWRAFVHAQPDSNIFHTPEMCRVFEQAEHHRTQALAATDASGFPVALLTSVEVTLIGGLLRPWTSRAVAYGGLLCSGDPVGRDGVRQLLARYRRMTGRRPLFTELRHLSDPSLFRDILEDDGFSHEDHLNFLIDLDRPEEVLLGGLSRTAQQRVRSGQRKGVVIEDETDALRLDLTYPMLDDVYKRVGVPLADRSLFHAALSILHPRGMFRIFSARLGERIIATRYVLLHRDTIVDWYAGADRGFASYSPSEVLVWWILRWGHEHGYRTFDFGGAGRLDEPYGPREFKAKFGGELVNFGRDVFVHAPARLRLSRAGYAVARRLLWHRADTREPTT
jgi:CelD/BcsL family acetyltransferase involved in cellulose biosynthesis